MITLRYQTKSSNLLLILLLFSDISRSGIEGPAAGLNRISAAKRRYISPSNGETTCINIQGCASTQGNHSKQLNHTMSRTVKAAIVTETGKPPVFHEVTLAAAGEDEVTIKVVAAGYSHLVRGRASGAHYSASKSTSIVGVDGVGYVEGTGALVYFFSLGGSYSQYVNVNKRSVFPFPEGITSENAIASVAALTNGAMSSIMALSRINNLPSNPTVVVIGATGVAGHIAIQVSKTLYNAKRVIGIGRNAEKLKALKASEPLLDDIISYADKDEDLMKNETLADADVVLDYVWGLATMRFMTIAIKSKKVSSQALSWVEIGGVSEEPTIPLPSAALRSNNFSILGSGLGPLTGEEMHKCLCQATELLAKGDLNFEVKGIPLEDVTEEWAKPWSNDEGRKYFIISH